MTTATLHPHAKAIEDLARDLEKLDAAEAEAVIEKAREHARLSWLRQQIREGDATESLDGPTVMAELLAEADADIEAASHRGKA